ncbi:MAG: PHB depolymerase family esterase [Sphingorhabdus sp.]
MKSKFLQGMLEATRLTKSGKVGDATALIKHLVSSTGTMSPAAKAKPDWTPARSIKGAVTDHAPHHGPRRRLQPPRIVEVKPAATNSKGRFEEHVYSSAAGQRGYKLYIPMGYSGEPLPLVVMLHGCTQSPDDFAAGTQMNQLADETGFFVAYPAQSRSANLSGCWNWFKAEDQKNGTGEPALITGIAHQIMANLSVDAQHVYVAGLSAGGAMAAILGVNYPDLFAAIGVHSGLACGAADDMFSGLQAMKSGGGRQPKRGSGRAIPAIIFHGDHDSTVHPVNGNELIAQLGGEGILTPPTSSTGKSAGGLKYTQSVQSDASGKTVSEQWVIHGAGHAWSGGSSKGSYTEPNGVDASREMIRFFLTHSLN